MEWGYMATLAIVAFYGLPLLIKQIHWSIKAYAVFLIFYFVAEIYALQLAQKKIENQWLYNRLGLIEYPVTILIFYSYNRNKILKTLILFLGVGLILFSILNYFYFQPDVNSLQTNVIVIGGCLVILLSIVYFAAIYSSDQIGKITDDPIFWFSSSVILGYVPMVPFYGMLNYLTDNYLDFTFIYLVYIMNTFFILSHICLFICYFRFYKTSKPYPKSLY